MVADQLTEAQRTIITEMERRKAEAILFQGQWRFRDDVRQNPELAQRMVGSEGFRSAPYWPLTRLRGCFRFRVTA